MLKRVMSNQLTEFGLPNKTGDGYVAALTIDKVPNERRALISCVLHAISAP